MFNVQRRTRLLARPQRAEAIELVVGLAAPGDVVVVAGKGHETEIEIGTGLRLPPIKSPEEQLGRIVMLFRELRDGKTQNGKTKLKTASGSLSTAEAISRFLRRSLCLMRHLPVIQARQRNVSRH